MWLKMVALAVSTAISAVNPAGDVYFAWTDNGYHVAICDNGTPEDLEDDFVFDWEDNRAFEIRVFD